MKTKVGSLSVIICSIIVVFFCILACDNGSVSDSSSAAKSNGLVKVSLSVGEKTSGALQKSISVSSDIVIGSLICKYNAVPQWVGSRIYGAADWTTVNYSDEINLGYFTPGLWKFGVRLIKIVDGNEIIVYEGYSGVESISTSSVAINIVISKIVEQAAKSVTISVTAPTVDGEALSISYTGTASSAEPIPANITGRANGLTTFEYSFSQETTALDSGNYTFTLNHPLGGSGAAVAVDLRPGEQVQITGHIDNGIWQLGAVTVKIHTMDISTNVELCSVYANTVSAAAGERVSFYLVPYDGAVLKDGTTISVTYVSDPQTEVTPLTQEGGMYTFIMPDADVVVNAEFDGVSEDIPIPHFSAMLKILYDSTITTFGHEDIVPNQNVELFRIKYMTLWKNGTKICWHASSPLGNVKFAAGSMASLFKDCSTFTNIDLTGFDTSKVNNMAHMFDGCLQLQSVNLTGIDTSEVKDMSYMFYMAGYNDIPETKTQGGQKQLIKKENTNYLSITGMNGFDTGKVTNMEYMFSICSAKTLDVSSFNASKVTNFSHMFAGKNVSNSRYWPTKFTSLALENWNVGGNVGANTIDMSNMFDICNMIETISFTDNPVPASETKAWKFDKVINMKEMFNRCESASKIIFPKHTDLTNVTTMLSLFNRDQQIPLTGSGSFTDIFSRWDISGNDYNGGPNDPENPPIGGGMQFTSPVIGYGDESPNRLMQDTEALKHLASVRFDTYTPTIKVEIGSTNGNLAIANQRLKKVKIVNP